jgi:hypothetical protein
MEGLSATPRGRAYARITEKLGMVSAARSCAATPHDYDQETVFPHPVPLWND